MFETLDPKRIGWQPYIYLIYLGFLFFQPFLDPDTTVQVWVYTLTSIAVFVPLYFWTGSQRGWKAFIGIAGIGLLGALSMYINSGATVYFIYAAALAGVVARVHMAVRILVTLLLGVVLSFLLSPIPFPFRFFAFTPAFIFVPTIGFLNIVESERERSRRKLERANQEIEHLATIAERERIARDLHDLLGHTLSVITLKSELASKLIDKDVAKAKLEIKDVEQISRETLTEVRSAVSGYRQKGFMSEVASAKLALESAGVSFAFKGDASILSALQESTLSLVLREAVTNIIRHASATRCLVGLSEKEESFELEISDNGRGIKGDIGNGLIGIRERVTLLGGRFELSGLGGTRLWISLPKAAPLRQLEVAKVKVSLEPS